jgi:hypothetical protein
MPAIRRDPDVGGQRAVVPRQSRQYAQFGACVAAICLPGFGEDRVAIAGAKFVEADPALAACFGKSERDRRIHSAARTKTSTACAPNCQTWEARVQSLTLQRPHVGKPVLLKRSTNIVI